MVSLLLPHPTIFCSPPPLFLHHSPPFFFFLVSLLPPPHHPSPMSLGSQQLLLCQNGAKFKTSADGLRRKSSSLPICPTALFFNFNSHWGQAYLKLPFPRQEGRNTHTQTSGQSSENGTHTPTHTHVREVYFGINAPRIMNAEKRLTSLWRRNHAASRLAARPDQLHFCTF